jgi:NitT/TauT family transport system substrate-binding protein
MLEYSSSASALAPGVILWSADRSNGGDALVTVGEITSFSQLAGKRVGLEVGTPEHLMLIYQFGGAKIPSDNVRLRDLPITESTEEFLATSLDATAAFYPHLQLALRRKGSHIIMSSADMQGANSIRDIIAISPTFVREHPRAVRDFYIGWCAALRYMVDYPQEAHQIMAANLSISVQELEQELTTVQFYGHQENTKLFQSGLNSEIVQNVQQMRRIWQSGGFARRVDSIASRVSGEIVNSVSASEIDQRLQVALKNQ